MAKRHDQPQPNGYVGGMLHVVTKTSWDCPHCRTKHVEPGNCDDVRVVCDACGRLFIIRLMVSA